jgi:hypothetical protein
LADKENKNLDITDVDTNSFSQDLPEKEHDDDDHDFNIDYKMTY